ncbi:MAG TPA: chromate efflux transporter [Solirubrobacterales bacterium]|nr:chromate efflux transporter [Solirubrobacterales bacterium]
MKTPAPPQEITAPPSSGQEESKAAIFIRFLKFGCLAWGGPAAQIAMIKRECVDEEMWISEWTFKKLLAVYQILPGPEAHELCVYFGRLRGGKLGGFLAGLGFMLPGFVLMLGLSILYVEANLAGHLSGLFYGLTAAVGALVARALVRLSKSFISDVPLAIIAIVGFALTIWTGLTFVLVLLGGGIAYELWKNGRRWIGGGSALSISPLAILVVATGAITISLTATIFFEGLKAGLLTFGGAYTVIPFLREAAVENHHWLTSGQFNDGLAMGGVLPAPLIIFSTFVGYIAGGLGGALVMTLGIFLPAFVFPIFLHRQLVAVSENERLHPFLLGVAAAVIGLIAAVTVTILETGVTDVYTALIALGAFAALQRWHGKLSVVYVMAAAGVIGAILQHTIV